jgi:drug/metabolite transporter (DMT)-like permease
MSHRSAVLLLIITSALWSLGGVLIKSVDWPSMAKAGARSAIAAVIMLAWMGRPKFTWSWSQIGAALAYVGTVSLFVIANDRTTAANAIFLQYTAPIYVAFLGGWFLGEKTRRIDWLCIGLALFGIALFFRDDFDARGLLGIIVALGSGISFATMVMLLRKEKDTSPESSLLLGNLLAAAIGLPFGLGHGLPGSQWTILAILGAVQLGVPYILYSIAIKRVTALEAILIPMLEPILNPIWVALARGEIPGAWSLAGGGLVLSAVLIRSLIR